MFTRLPLERLLLGCLSSSDLLQTQTCSSGVFLPTRHRFDRIIRRFCQRRLSVAALEMGPKNTSTHTESLK